MRAAEVKLQPGSVFAAEYRIVGQLDEGGMGLLYRAEQLSTGEERALKVLKPSLLADGVSRERFSQEATIGANIPSDHVVKVIGAGIDDETGIPWIAMELLRGDNLHRVVRARGPLPPLDALEIFAQLCHALGAAHRTGIVHRDLKPENIFIARALRRDARSTVKLLDFGIAKVIQAYETSVSATAIVGSPLWMAPEQVRRGRIRPSTDVWALGLLAFWMLTGKYYWRAAQSREAGQAEAILHEKLYEPIEPASKRAGLLDVADRLPAGFDEWFRRCVARDADDRFADADSAFEGLRAVLTRTAPPWSPRLRGAALGASLAAVLLSGGWLWGSTRSHPIARPHARAPIAAAPMTQAPATPLATRVEPTSTSAPPSIAPPAAQSPHAAVTTPPMIAGASRPVARDTSRPRVTPAGAGYVFRARSDASGVRCTDRAHGHGWEVTPDWAAALADRLQARERTLQNERRMAQRSPNEEIAARVMLDERLLAQERALATAQIERSVPGERARSTALARGSRCLDAGLHVVGTSVYAVWCCP